VRVSRPDCSPLRAAGHGRGTIDDMQGSWFLLAAGRETCVRGRQGWRDLPPGAAVRFAVALAIGFALSAGVTAGLTCRGALSEARARLRGLGPTAALDARLLVAGAAGLDMTALLAAPERPLDTLAAARLDGFLERRAGGEPVARILGEKEFWGLSFALSPETLVPRPDTEIVVEAALAAAGSMPAEITIADLGTGTGAILIALLAELAAACGVAVDVSAGALATARRNAERHGVADRMRFVEADYREAPLGAFDLVVCNPPYIPTAEIAGLGREVRDHDPRLALDGGADGLDHYRALGERLPRLLRPGGAAVIEVGTGQAEAARLLLAGPGLAFVRAAHDLLGTPRALVIAAA